MSTKQGGLKDIASGRSDIYRLDPDLIQVKAGWNCRDTTTEDYKAGIIELARSIAESGVKEAMTVYWEDGVAYLSNGHRRLDAVKYAKAELGAEIKTVPVQLESRFADEAERVMSMIVRNSGVPFTPLENAHVFKRLCDLGWSVTDIAGKIGYTDTRVRQTLDLLALPEPVKTRVKKGEIAPATAAKVVKKVGKEKADSVIAKGVETAKAKGRKKTTTKDMIEELVGSKPEKKAKVSKLDPVVERLKAILEDAEFADDLYVSVNFPRAVYEELCALVGAKAIEPSSSEG